VRETSNLRYLKHPQIELVYGGLDAATDWEQALADVETIYHVAGLTFARRREDYFRVNHRGTEQVLAEAIKRRAQLKKFVLISSLAAAGPGRNGIPIDEDVTPDPITAYGRSKLMGEEAVRTTGGLVDWTIVRPPAVYGPRDYALYELFKSIARGVAPTIGRNDKMVSLVHARDLADGIILAGESRVSTGRTYFISSEEVYSLKAIVELLSGVFSRKVRTVSIPRALAYGAAVVAEAAAALARRPPVINRDKVTDLAQTCWGCSIARARRDLGYSPRITLEEGLRETIEWYRGQGWL
jgi:nucleoside-diphosphate-sugar epimerase